jgi:hypothetical protein
MATARPQALLTESDRQLGGRHTESDSPAA